MNRSERRVGMKELPVVLNALQGSFIFLMVPVFLDKEQSALSKICADIRARFVG